MGLVLYIYEDKLILCAIIGGGLTLLSIIICIILIRLKVCSYDKVHV